MRDPRKRPDAKKPDQAMADLRRELDERAQGYRGRALKLFPHVCGHCGREFEGKRLKELTVHHKDHNHNNNPPDGSNWELLCTYCHEYEHVNHEMESQGGGSNASDPRSPTSTFKAFQGLDALLKPAKKNETGA